MLGAFLTLFTRISKIEPAATGELVKVRVTDIRFVPDDTHVAEESEEPAVHVREEGPVNSEGKVKSNLSPDSK